ncbi:MAG: heme NO-binding domain-containing protein [Halioglobus sp.]
MYGLINNALQGMIREKFGEEQWEKVFEASGVPADSFLTMRSYDDKITYDLAFAASDVLGAPVATCLEMFGEYWVLETASKSYGPLMDAAGGDIVEFLENLNALHDRITSTFLNYRPPEFQIKKLPSGTFDIHYHSEREGFVPFVVGLLKGLAQRFGNSMEILKVTEEDVPQGVHAIFEISVK